MVDAPMTNEKLYSTAGPFTVECDGNPLLGIYRCWLTTDPAKKVLCEGSARDLENYFKTACSAAEPSGQ